MPFTRSRNVAFRAAGRSLGRFRRLLHLGVVLRIGPENTLDDILGRFSFPVGFLAGLRPVAGIGAGQFLHQLLSCPGTFGSLTRRLPLLHDGFATLLLLSRLPGLIVKIALFGVFQKVVSLPDFGESRRSIGIVAIGVRMDGFRLRAPGSLDFLMAGVTFHAEDRIWIAHAKHQLRWLSLPPFMAQS